MEGVLKAGGMPLSVVARVTTWPLIGLLALPVIGWALGGGVWQWLTVIVFVAVSLIDPFVGPDNVNHRTEDETALEKSLYYRAMLWLLVPLQWAVAVFCRRPLRSALAPPRRTSWPTTASASIA